MRHREGKVRARRQDWKGKPRLGRQGDSQGAPPLVTRWSGLSLPGKGVLLPRERPARSPEGNGYPLKGLGKVAGCLKRTAFATRPSKSGDTPLPGPMPCQGFTGRQLSSRKGVCQPLSFSPLFPQSAPRQPA